MIVQLVIEVVDSDNEDDRYDDLVTVTALKLAGESKHRMPRHSKDVVSKYFHFEIKRFSTFVRHV